MLQCVCRFLFRFILKLVKYIFAKMPTNYLFCSSQMKGFFCSTSSTTLTTVHRGIWMTLSLSVSLPLFLFLRLFRCASVSESDCMCARIDVKRIESGVRFKSVHACANMENAKKVQTFIYLSGRLFSEVNSECMRENWGNPLNMAERIKSIQLKNKTKLFADSNVKLRMHTIGGCGMKALILLASRTTNTFTHLILVLGMKWWFLWLFQ